MKKVFEFRRNDSEKGRRLRIEVELTNENNFRACCAGPAIYWGQCLDRAQKELNIKNPTFKKILKFHALYHLNDLHAGNKLQEEAVNEYLKDNSYDYNKVCKYLESRNLLVVDGYRYGSGWIKFDIPQDALKEIKELLAD